jgi:hypothetical protein
MGARARHDVPGSFAGFLAMREGAYVPEELREMDNVILAPHDGGATHLSRNQQVIPMAPAIKMLIEGERPPGLLNAEIYGEAVLHPQLDGRGPIRPAGEGGIPGHSIYEE